MKHINTYSKRVVTIAILCSAFYGFAAVVNPNGFPSGPHYNLNIIGKKLDYQCDPALQVDISGDTIYGGVIKVPETGEDIQIVMRSGKKGSKLVTATELRVLDSCAPYFDGDAAVVELPPSEKGYNVYARALGKPGGRGTLTYGGNVFVAQDEYGNDLVALGLVTSTSATPVGEEVVRSKGKSVAVDITRLFLWSGTVCQIDFATTPSPGPAAGYVPVCWIDTWLTDATQGVAGLDPTDTFKPATPDGLGGYTCPEGGTLIWVHTKDCVTYTNDWIFNIADLVESDWLLDNNGSKLIQLRFYPVL